MRKRTIIISDIHGMLADLKRLLIKCNFSKENDRLILAGDLVDRGPESAGVVAFAMDVGAEVIVGNHDEKYIRFRKHLRKNGKQREHVNPMLLSSEKEIVWHSLTYEQIDFLENCPCYISLPEYNTFVVHAGVLPNKPVDKQDRQVYLYVRYIEPKTLKRMHLVRPNFTQPPGSVHWTELYEDTIDIVYGHDVQSLEEPTILTNSNGGRTIGIDTGACFGGKMTATIYSEEIPKGEFVQVDVKKGAAGCKVVERSK